ncbi:MAG: general secretion pathway protein GspK [bacterium]
MRKSAKNRLSVKRLQEHGSLTIMSLWMLALLSLLAMGLIRNVLMEFRLNTYELRAEEATWLARAGIQQAIAVLKEDLVADSLQFHDAFPEPWAHNPALFKRVACGNGFFDVAYETNLEQVGRSYLFGICDENRKINVNRVPKEILGRLPGMNQEKSAALLDWRDQDSKPRNGGAEDGYYQSLLHPYRCKNADFDFVEELALVRGFSSEQVRVLAPLVTVFGDGSVNINTAPAEVLEILGLNKKLARRIVTARWGPDGIPFTADDLVIKSPDEIVTSLTQWTKLKPVEQLLLHRLVGEHLLDVRSTHFTIESVGVTLNGEVRRKVSATVERLSPKEVNVVSWKEMGT